LATECEAKDTFTGFAALQALPCGNIMPLDLNCVGQSRENAQGKLNAEFRAVTA